MSEFYSVQNYWKSILLFFLLAATCFFLVGCSDKENKQSDVDQPEVSADFVGTGYLLPVQYITSLITEKELKGEGLKLHIQMSFEDSIFFAENQKGLSLEFHLVQNRANPKPAIPVNKRIPLKISAGRLANMEEFTLNADSEFLSDEEKKLLRVPRPDLAVLVNLYDADGSRLQSMASPVFEPERNSSEENTPDFPPITQNDTEEYRVVAHVRVTGENAFTMGLSCERGGPYPLAEEEKVYSDLQIIDNDPISNSYLYQRDSGSLDSLALVEQQIPKTFDITLDQDTPYLSEESKQAIFSDSLIKTVIFALRNHDGKLLQISIFQIQKM